MFLSCSSKLHLQPLHIPLWLNITAQSKLNAKILFNTSYCSCFSIYIHTHTLTLCAAMADNLHIKLRSCLGHTKTHRKSVHRETRRQRRDRSWGILVHILYIHSVHIVLLKKRAKSSAHTSPAAGKIHLHVTISFANMQLKSIYTYCILYI